MAKPVKKKKKSKRNLKHPVWDVYDLYRETRFYVLYYSEKLNEYKRLNTVIEVVLAITTSSSAVAALWLWDTTIGQEIWKYILVVSAILAVLKPILKLTEKVQQYEAYLTGYRGLETDVKLIVIQINQSKNYGTIHRSDLIAALSRQGELTLKSPESKLAKKLEYKCRQQVEIELPAEKFFVP